MSDAKVFIDTNILVYAYDVDAKHKYTRAAETLEQLWLMKNGCLSLQVLQEFYVTATQKLKTPLPRDRARSIVERFGEWDPIPPDLAMVLNATNLAERRQLSFWDALIVVTAIDAGATVLYSEDFATGSTIEGLLVVNPLVG